MPRYETYDRRDDWITIHQAASMLRYWPSTVRNLIDAGTFQSPAVGRVVQADVDRFLEAEASSLARLEAAEAEAGDQTVFDDMGRGPVWPQAE
jgi:hypothetical protein